MPALVSRLAAIAILIVVGGCSGPATDAAAAAAAAPPGPAPQQTATETPMRIRIITADRTLTAVLEDNETARDFAALLPLGLTFDDFNRTEKIADLPRKLSTTGAPDRADPAAGDIAYYAPWGNLAIYYRDFSYSPGLVRLGRLDGDPAAMAELSAAAVRVELIPQD